MWLLIAYPPLVVPLSVDRPGICPLCGGHEAPYVHAHINRALPGLVRTTNEHGKRLVTHYSTVRFRCRRCRRTFSPALPGWLDGFHLPQYVAARIVAWYCLGATPANVLRGVSLEVQPGEVRGLVGESGAGKSMLGRAVLGLLPANVPASTAERSGSRGAIS